MIARDKDRPRRISDGGGGALRPGVLRSTIAGSGTRVRRGQVTAQTRWATASVTDRPDSYKRL